MKILIKFPTRGRSIKFFNVLDQYISKASDLSRLAFLISMDLDDIEMNNNIVRQKFEDYKKYIKIAYFYGNSKTKIQACNADIDKISGWDIIMLASDDMIPIEQGYDEIIRKDMNDHFKDSDGVLWYNDGGQNNINTLSILGKKYYDRFNYIYHPDYISLWCDNEFTDVSLKLNKVYRSNKIIIEHQHPAWQKANFDELYIRNESYFGIDQQTYTKRKELEFPEIISRKNVLIYVGAHVGNSLQNYVNSYDEIYAFEANPNFCEHLKNRFKDNKNVTIINAAICEKHNDFIDFNISKNNGDSSSILKANKESILYDLIESNQTIKVPTVNLKNFLEENKINYIKTYISDTQGYDLAILKTLKPLIDNKMIEEIQCEVEKNEKPSIYVNENTETQNKEKNFDEFLKENYVKVATGWGNLEDNKFESVPEEWAEFDAKWKLKK
jgi:FkbM family methyltransferase